METIEIIKHFVSLDTYELNYWKGVIESCIVNKGSDD